MPSSKPLVDSNGEVREIRAADLDRFVPAAEGLPASLRQKIGVRGPQKGPTKERVTIRLSPDVVQRFRATGSGWQTRVDAALQDWLKTHKPAKSAR
ncbi:MAG: BrnA antitoxin family protein [Rubrivivax sp.]